VGLHERLTGAAKRLTSQAIPNADHAPSEATTATEDGNSGNVTQWHDLTFYIITRKEDFKLLPEMIASLPTGVKVNIVETIHDPKADIEAAATSTNGAIQDGRDVRTWEWRYPRWDFASARNAALATCDTSWAMWMDSDDRIPAIYHNDIIELVKADNPGVGGYMMGCAGYQPPYEAGARGSYYAVPHCRLHRVDTRITWRGYAHEQIDTAIQDSGYAIAESAVVVMHVGYVTDTKALAAKMGRNVMLLCRQISEDKEYIPAYYLNALKDNLTTYLHMKENING
jgi:hypothetical protein